ncbi:hypothetical protein [Dankookia sp. P2]|uniref:hypothetical protein n=1 Tax=Dankookia sp. P2 TaxID=3423955 RepID=UPI003D677448
MPGPASLTRRIRRLRPARARPARPGAADPAGILFLALGLFVLRDQYDWAREGMAKLRARWPRQVEGVEALEGRLVGWSRRQAERVKRLLP